MTAAAHATTTGNTEEHATTGMFPELVERTRVLVVAGIATGVVVVGIGSRLAMFVLRLTSPDGVRGIKSDDGFEIGRFTLGGTYNLLMLGAAVGIIGAATYRAVAPWLVGPHWFRRVTIGLAAGAVGGSMLVHADGIDFRFLKPLWLAIGLFVALPAVFAVAIGAAVDRVAAPDSWTKHGRRSWVLPVVLLAAFPFSVLPLALCIAGLTLWLSLRAALPNPVGMPISLLVRGAWLAIAVMGLVALIGDIDGLT